MDTDDGGPLNGKTIDDTPGGGAEGDGALVERLLARGHENVSADHESTLEVTTDDWLTPAGDCILAVAADRAPADFDDDFLDACRDAGATVTATLRVFARDANPDDDPTSETTVKGRGHPDLTFESERSAVCRTSDYVDGRTVMVGADRAAADLDRELVAALADGADAEFVLRVE